MTKTEERIVKQDEKLIADAVKAGEFDTGIRGFRCFVHHGSWVLGYSALCSSSGRKQVKSLSTTDATLALERMRAARTQLKDGKTSEEINVSAKPGKAGITVAQLAELFLSERTNEITVETIVSYKAALNRWVAGHAQATLGPLPAQGVTPQQVEALLLRIRRTKNRYGRNNRRGAALNVLRILGAMFKWGIRRRLITGPNPCAGLTHATVDAQQEDNGERPLQPFSRDEQRVLLAKARADHSGLTMILLGLRAGLRIGEIVALGIDDLDFKEGTIHVWQHRSPVRNVLLKGTKNKRRGARVDRTVPMDLAADLRPALLEQVRLRELENSKRGWESRMLFVNRLGTGHSMPGWRSAVWAPLRAECKLDTHTFHDTRATFTSELLESGAPLGRVARWTGDTEAVLQQRYRHIIEVSDAEFVGVLGKLDKPLLRSVK